ncbi:MAG: discoidin domain-containing protein [Desulfomonilaceae bacterium]
MVRKDAIQPVTHYDYDFVPGACLEYNIIRGNRYEYANNAGFRDPREISAEKPADEFRIFLTGGSTAYGLGPIGQAAAATDYYTVEFRETIAHCLEMILNSNPPIEGKKIRVYNTAVWGHAFQHLLIRYPVKLRNYQPDMVISLDGANELPLISKIDPNWNYFHEGQYNNILRDIFSYSATGFSSYLTLWLKNNTYLMTYLWSGQDIFQEMNVRSHKGVADSQAIPNEAGKDIPNVMDAKSTELDRNIATVVRTVEDYSALLKNDEIPHILGLQPWFYLSKKPLNQKEKFINEIEGYRQYYGMPSDKVYKLLIDKLVDSAKKKGYFLVDFSEYFDDVSQWVFTDWCHLTGGANYLIAKELANIVKEHFFGKSLTPEDLISNKDSFFVELVGQSDVVKAPTAADSQSGTENFQRGYPGQELYVSTELAQGEIPEVVIDLKKTREVSRARIVWGDEQSTPAEWVLEVSTDGKEWKTFCSGDRQAVDYYSWWPGYEFYGSIPMQARFVRYRPTKMANPVIKLRLWSLFR